VLAAVILAAGASSRMGEPKALLPWRGRSFVAHVIAGAQAAGCAPVVVVEGCWPLPDDAIDGAVRCRHEGWAAGPVSSLVAGLRALAGAMPTMIGTVDRPHVSHATWRALARAAQQQPGRVWQPRFAGRRGHPLVLPAWLTKDVDRIAAMPSLRELLAADDVTPCRDTIDVDDPAVLDNIDDRAAWARLAEIH
jgi:CTP:molybdopterin cytidylyltransferase MocA